MSCCTTDSDANLPDRPTKADPAAGQPATHLVATSLFIDVRQSSDITDPFRRETAIKMMKYFFFGSVKIINYHDGSVRSFNGDGMLATFVGDSQ